VLEGFFRLRARSPLEEESASLVEDTRAVLLDLDCSYQQRHFASAFARRRWRIVTRRRRGGDFPDAEEEAGDAGASLALRVEEYETIPWGAILGAAGAGAGVSSFCVRKGLGRKGAMAEALAAHAGKCGPACPLRSALPPTVVVDASAAFVQRPRWLDFRSALAESLSDAEDAIERAAAEAAAAGADEPLWILKPSITNKGEGLRIVSAVSEVEAAVRELPEMGQWVLQRYVDRPLLLRPGVAPASGGGHKFHLRVYVLAAGALRALVFREALVLLAARPYARATARDDAHRAAHVTNTCVGAGDAAFEEAAHVRSSAELPALALRSGAAATPAAAEARTARALADVRAAVRHCFAAMEGRAGLYMPLPAPSFELYGADFLLDERWRAVLLEFNPSPDIKQSGARLDGLIARMVDGVVGIAAGERDAEGWEEVYAKEWPRAGKIVVS
jgi:tubulin--tyrosine ligase